MRRIDLDKDTLDRLFEAHETVTSIDGVIADLVVKTAAEKAKLKMEWWDSVYRLAGLDRDDPTVKLKVDFAARCIVVSETDPQPPTVSEKGN